MRLTQAPWEAGLAHLVGPRWLGASTDEVLVTFSPDGDECWCSVWGDRADSGVDRMLRSHSRRSYVERSASERQSAGRWWPGGDGGRMGVSWNRCRVPGGEESPVLGGRC